MDISAMTKWIFLWLKHNTSSVPWLSSLTVLNDIQLTANQQSNIQAASEQTEQREQSKPFIFSKSSFVPTVPALI